MVKARTYTAKEIYDALPQDLQDDVKSARRQVAANIKGTNSRPGTILRQGTRATAGDQYVSDVSHGIKEWFQTALQGNNAQYRPMHSALIASQNGESHYLLGLLLDPTRSDLGIGDYAPRQETTTPPGQGARTTGR